MKRVHCRALICCGLLTLTAVGGPPAGAAHITPTPLPAWQVLEFEQQAFLVT